MKKGIKFRAYPNKEQETLILKTFGCCRMIYNKGLAIRREAYENGQKCGYNETSKLLTELKKQENFNYLKEIDSVALQQSLRDLESGYQRLFNKIAKQPVFKDKHSPLQSYRTVNQHNKIRIEGNKIKLPKIGYLKIKQSMNVGKINNVTIERTKTGKYFVVLNIDFEPERKCKSNTEIGIDVGIKEFYTDSNGNVVNNPKYLEKATKKLRKQQRKFSNMIDSHIKNYKVVGNKKYPIYDKPLKECKNVQKQRVVLAKLHEDVYNKRKDFLHKESTKLVRENQTICVEDLNVNGMLRNHKLAKSISSVSWSEFFRMLEYKASWYGATVIRIPTFYPSSQTCSCCGFKNPIVKKLSVRKWECPSCNTMHDRDENASVNILNKGLQMLTI